MPATTDCTKNTYDVPLQNWSWFSFIVSLNFLLIPLNSHPTTQQEAFHSFLSCVGRSDPPPPPPRHSALQAVCRRGTARGPFIEGRNYFADITLAYTAICVTARKDWLFRKGWHLHIRYWNEADSPDDVEIRCFSWAKYVEPYSNQH